MPRKPSEPCSSCGTLMVVTTDSTGRGQMRCRPCRSTHSTAGAGRKRRTCEVCGTQYLHTYWSQRTCGRKCGAVLQAQSRPPAKPKAKPEPQPKTCVVCGASFVGKRRMFCSDKCLMVRWPGNVARTGMTETVTCGDCGVQFSWVIKGRGSLPRLCETCRAEHLRSYKREHRRRRDARKRGAACETFTSREIFERDRWICQLCNKRVPKKAKVPHPKAATLDHVVPLAEGGAHTRANVQLAHFECNWMKGDKGEPQQLKLFA